ncbi:MAG: endonuclease/exonuclease/phosphatase family protein [Planctomycetia bacterium]|nr:endonuclease/exonuclease/phosphatase family protein [Planctomycetia bacterium]
MSRFSFLLTLTLVAVGVFSAVNMASSVSAAEARLMTYNIRNGRALTGSEIRLELPAGVIRKAAPDVVGIQELDFRTTRSGNRDIPAELGELVGFQVEFARAIDFQGGGYGIGTLSKTEPLRTYSVPLPGAEERRVLQVTEFADFVFFNTHFSLTEASRLESIAIIETERKKFTKPIFLCGDFNAVPDSAPMKELSKTWRMLSPVECTYPADEPRIPIDHFWTPCDVKNVEVLDARVICAPSESDHRPVFIHVRF